MSSPKNECELKGGHPPAVKAGGMRITQHKTRKDSGGLTEDTTGITISSSPPKATTVSGAIAKGHADFPPEAVQSFHKEKPPMSHSNVKPIAHIQQPRK
ncbi:death-associated protein 1-like [Aethina tumida]|uniref:death-associated protein 1-like n=1 Tax=Aethina tumida TaxID=116153 RepID=UPI00096B23BC|nr:death-associated protein 1-like [Aethina tumida]